MVLKTYGGLDLGLETQSLGLGLCFDKKVLFTSLGRTNIQTVTFSERQLRRQRLTGLLVMVRLDAANIGRLLAHQYVHQLRQRQFELCAGLQQQTHITSTSTT